jgi:hypothetical protein
MYFLDLETLLMNVEIFSECKHGKGTSEKETKSMWHD